MEGKTKVSLSDDLKENENPATLVLEEIDENAIAKLIIDDSNMNISNNGDKTKVNDIKFSHSITSKIIQSDETVKSYYSDLKNHILSYSDVKSRLSWKFDTYYKGRKILFKIKIRGKTICLYCCLNPEEFDKSQYNQEAINAVLVEDVPMLVKIKNSVSLKKAKELIDIEMTKFKIKKLSNFKAINYVSKYPYEDTDTLINRGLIKVLIPNDL